MHVFLYEWVTGGGLVEDPGPLPPTLTAEGGAMIEALADDFLGIDGCQVSALRDMRLDKPSLRGCDVVEIHSRAHGDEEIERLAAEADFTLLIAPEFDNILLNARRQVSPHVLNSSAEFIRLASNKQATAEHLRAAGVAVPPAVVLEADAERLPDDADYPAVLKPLDGAGSQHTLLVQGPGDQPAPHPWPRRLERFCVGRPASVGFLCGPDVVEGLPPCWQRVSDDGRFTYLGGALIKDPSLRQRAAALARQTVAVLPPAHGFVGVDLILGNAPDAADDVVLEVNPRVTTSYVGLRAAVKDNLAQLLVRVAQGEQVAIDAIDAPLEFSADGAVWNAGGVGGASPSNPE